MFGSATKSSGKIVPVHGPYAVFSLKCIPPYDDSVKALYWMGVNISQFVATLMFHIPAAWHAKKIPKLDTKKIIKSSSA